ncbi:MAG: thioredoxin-disulfide reductase [Bacteroides sp.]|nr:thioredoxin-disulfide reductase [Bacteroides sp.]MCM1380149.1 thioredoxin-disulfide reductase [Bacteroides sp.]MCM1445729.1 thioredoxin-disulfide reductase [Prevotella sp.]
MKTKCLIIGSGPAGYTAAIYTSRANLKPILVEGYVPGGQLTTTTEVENFPGYPEGVTGQQLMADLRKQAERFGAEIHTGRIDAVNFDVRPFTAHLDSGDWIEADTVIVATGASAMYLGLPDEEKYMGMGVSACATCDGFFYRKKTVAVVGGGDTACEEALYLSGLATKVYMLVRKPQLRASKVMQKRVMEKENIEILYNTNTLGLYGEEFLEGAHLIENRDTTAERTYDLPIDGFFLGIGHKPETELFKFYLELDERGFIKTFNGTTQTSVPGVFAAGDVADPRYQQAISAAGMGCRAALDADAFLIEN